MGDRTRRFEARIERGELTAKIQVSRLPQIKGDSLQLNQLFINLLQNALKFRSRNRVLAIEIEHCDRQDWHQITISDNGIGFESEQQLKIFTPFHRLHSQSKISGNGTGFGYFAPKIVARHRGKISASSQIDRGGNLYNLSAKILRLENVVKRLLWCLN